MNCTEVNEKIADLFDDSISKEMKEKFFAHFHECVECRKLYEELSNAAADLKPRIMVGAVSDFHERTMDKIMQSENSFRKKERRTIPSLSPVWKRVIAIAAVVAIVFLLFPVFNHSGSLQNKGYASTTLLQNSIQALSGVKSVRMVFNVRALKGDNFDFIDKHADFVEHKLWKVFGEKGKWRIEKPGRMVVMDGTNQYMYCPQAGMALKAGPDAGFVGWMRILLDPEEILNKEKENARKNGSKFRVEDNGNNTVLTVTASAMGDFTNSYLLNTSIPESNNTRIYTFDKSTHLLKSFEVFIDSSGKSYKILELKEINYNEPVDEANFIIKLPENINWATIKEIEEQAGVAGITSHEAAKRFFTACHSEDWNTVRQFIPGFLNFIQLQFEVKQQYGGLTIISLGKSFKSGRYPGEFVPYEVKFKSGYVKKWNLALRNDNPEKKWVIDGGF